MCLRFMARCTKFTVQSERGNVFLAIFGAIALVGLLGASVMTFMKGPLASSVRLTKLNTAENQMQIGAQVAVMATASQPDNGDCDSDGTVEPVPFRSPTTEPVPTGGGLVPLTVGINKKDPWGTEYGYCVWNHGATQSGGLCGANMLEGTGVSGYQAYPVVALISAGPDKTFSTTCRSFAAADVVTNGNLLDAGDLPLVSKAAETDDDVITTFTYEEATSASGGLWNLKAGNPNVAVINKSIESSGVVSSGSIESSGVANLKGGILLPDKSFIDCSDVANAGVMAKSSGGIEICDGSGVWKLIGGNGSTKLDDQTVQTNAMCDGTAIGQLRYNTSSGSSGGVTFKGVNSVHLPGNSGRSSLTMTIPVPTGTAAGDLLLYAISDDGCGTFTWPPGFTELQRTDVSYPDGQCWAIAYKVATGSETNLSFNDDDSWSISGSVVAYSGVSTSSPINGSSKATTAPSSNPWTMSSGNLTTTVANTQLVWFGAADTDNTASGFDGSGCTTKVTTFTPPSGFTKRADIQGLVDPYTCFNPMAIADAPQAAAGPTGVLTAGLMSTTGGDASTGTMMVALNSASGGGGGSTKTVEVCNGTGWAEVPENASTGTSTVKLENESVNTDLSCDGTQVGLMRYNTTGVSTTDTVASSGGGGGGGSTPAIVQQSPTVFHAPSQNLSIPPTIGNSIVVLLSGGGDGTTYCDLDGSTTLTDTYGNTYTKTVSTTETNVWADNAGIWIAPVTSTGPGFTVTFTNSSCYSWNTMQLVEVSGIDNSSPVDVAAETFGPGGYGHVHTLATPTTTSANAIAFAAYDHPGGYSSMSVSPGWTLIPGGDAGGGTYNIYKVLSSTGAVSNTWTADSDTRPPIAITVFKGAGSGGGGTSTVSGSTYAEICNGTKWVTVGHGFLDNLNDVITNYTGSSSVGKQSTTSMFFGKNVGAAATSGAANNTSVGVGSMVALTTGSGNTALGTSALATTTTGQANTAIGYQAGQGGTANTTGDHNTYIGHQTGANSNNYTNSTALGNGANITASNQIVLGDTAITEIRAQVTSITAISDKRKKKDIEDSELGLFFIDSLRPVQYRYNNGDNTLRYGFIAQETENVLPDNLKPLVAKESGLALVNHDQDKDQTYHMTYGELISPIVKAIQELSAKLEKFMTDTEKKITDILNHDKQQDEELKNLRIELDRLKLVCEKK